MHETNVSNKKSVKKTVECIIRPEWINEITKRVEISNVDFFFIFMGTSFGSIMIFVEVAKQWKGCFC